MTEDFKKLLALSNKLLDDYHDWLEAGYRTKNEKIAVEKIAYAEGIRHALDMVESTIYSIMSNTPID